MAYRILGLDGGGAWALIEVKVLIDIFGDKTTGHEVLSTFDLVAANSGGSIVLGGLVENMTLGGLLDFFNDEAKRQQIFSPTKSWGDDMLHRLLGFGPKYSTEGKLAALESLLPQTGAKPLAHLTSAIPGQHNRPVELMIVGFDYDYNRATFFRAVPPTGPALGVSNAPGITLAEAIHASTNAPIQYFDAPAQFPEHGERYWDGGVTGFNNPILAAVTEAIVKGVAPQDIAALSLGTGTVRLPVAAKNAPTSAFLQPWAAAGLSADLQKMASSVLDDPPDSASFIAHAMTKGGTIPHPAIGRVVRMSPQIAPVRLADSLIAPGGMTPAGFQALTKIDMDAILASEVAAITAYADLWLKDQAPNQLLHSDGQTVAWQLDGQKIGGAAAIPNPDPDRAVPAPENDLGYLTYSAARAAWKAIAGPPF